MPMTSTTATGATKVAIPAPASVKTTTPFPAPVKATTPSPAPVSKIYALRTPAASTVSAIQYLGNPDLAGQFAGHPTREDPLHQQTLVLVQTADGGRPAFPGDWIVTDSMGNASVMKDVDFVNKYAVDAPIAASKPLLAPAPAKPAAPAPVAAKPAVPAPVKPPAPVAAKPATPPAKQPVHDILT